MPSNGRFLCFPRVSGRGILKGVIFMLSTEVMNRIIIDVTLGRPAHDTSLEEKIFRENITKEMEEMKKQNIVMDVGPE